MSSDKTPNNAFNMGRSADDAIEFPRALEQAAFRSANGEYAWLRPDALHAVRILASNSRAVLGGELWLVRGGKVSAMLPQRSGPPAVYHWETARHGDESWPAYVARACREALSAIDALPGEGEVAMLPGAEVYYNLTWASSDESSEDMANR